MARQHGSGGRQYGSALVRALNAEWEDLSCRHEDTVRRWAGAYAVLRSCRSLDDVLQRVVEEPDPALAALLRAALGGEPLAARVVLQTMLGKLVRMAARDREASVDDYVAVLWCLIPRYPLARRPRSIAANLALDTLKGVRAGGRDAQVVPWPPGGSFGDAYDRATARARLDHGSDVADLTASRVLAAASVRKLINAETGELLTTVYVDGLPGDRAAERHHISAGSVRARCCKAVRCLAANSAVLAEAA